MLTMVWVFSLTVKSDKPDAFLLLQGQPRKLWKLCLCLPVHVVSGQLERYDFTSNNYRDLSKKRQIWRQISAALKISVCCFLALLPRKALLFFCGLQGPKSRLYRMHNILHPATRFLSDWTLTWHASFNCSTLACYLISHRGPVF